MLIARGADVVTVSRQLGHASPDITLRIYAHLFDQSRHAAATRGLLESEFASLLSLARRRDESSGRNLGHALDDPEVRSGARGPRRTAPGDRPRWRGTSFPLSAFAFQVIARKLGLGHVGIKRCRALIHRAKQCGLLDDASSYKARWPLRLVPTYRLGARIVGLGKHLGTRGLRRAHRQPTGGKVGFGKRPKRHGRWVYALFGTHDARPPSGSRQRRRRAMKSGDERWAKRGWRDP